MCFPDEANRAAEPSWFRENLLPHLQLPMDLPVHFIDKKTVTATDFDQMQQRFRLPAHGVMRNLCPILTAEELQAAKDVDDAPTRGGGGGGVRKKRKLERMHGGRAGGLPVQVVDAHAGIVALQMSSSRAASLKGQGYMGFIADCSFTIGDVVQIWAFREHASSFSPLYLVLAKKP